MKTVLSVITLLLCFHASFSQDPVKFKYAVKPTGNNSYKLYINAELENGWHIYSQQTPMGGPIRTSIKFTENPLIQLAGKPGEKGNMIKNYEGSFGINSLYYIGNVEFIQSLELKAAAKTVLSGTITYMTCNGSQCIPPRTVNFRVDIPPA